MAKARKKLAYTRMNCMWCKVSVKQDENTRTTPNRRRITSAKEEKRREMRQVCGDKAMAIHSANERSSVQQRRTTRKCSGNTRNSELPPRQKRREESEQHGRGGEGGEQLRRSQVVAHAMCTCQTRAAGGTRCRRALRTHRSRWCRAPRRWRVAAQHSRQKPRASPVSEY